MAGRRTFGQVYLRGSTWYVRTRLHGVTRIQKVGPEKRVAEDLLADMQAKMAKEEALGIREIAPASLEEVWNLIKHSRRARLTPRAFQVQRDHILAAAAFLGTRPLRDLRPQHVDDFLTSIASKGRKGTTLNRYHTSLSVVLREAVERGFAMENVARRVKNHRVEVHEVPYLGEPEVRRILAAAPRDLRPILAILADTGLRRGELLSLAWSDVDIGRGTVLVRRSKTGRGREVPLTTRARTAFDELHASRGSFPLRGEDLVFAPLLELQRPAVWKKAPDSEFTPRRRAENRLTHQFARVVQRLGMDGVTLHSLRHSCASRMVMAGVPLSAVARVTGHSTLRCAALYGKHAPQDAAKMAIRALEAAGAMPAAPAPEVPEGTPVNSRRPPPGPEPALTPAQAVGR